MTFCPTFGTLQAMVSGSKDFRRVFQSHPKSITRAVAYNIVGPALPQALRVIRYPYLKHGLRSNIVNDLSESSDDEYTSLDDEGIVSEVLDQLDPVVMATACPEDHRPTLLTTPEKKDLTSLAKLVASLEDVYSLTTKNRTSKTSVLTSDESFRFRRAMYRIMLYTRLFPLTQYHRDEIGYLYESGVEKIFQQRTAVLDVYPTDELFEIASVVDFMRGIFRTVDAYDEGNDQDYNSSLLETYLAAGPKGALKAWQSRSSDDLGDVYESLAFPEDADYHTGLFTEYFSRTLGEIWTARNVQSPGRDEGPDKWILDSAHGENDTCSQCADPGGVKLFTQANWSHLPRHYSFGLLKSKLRENRTVSNPFHEMWRKISRSLSDSDDPGRAITDLFELCAAARASTGSRSTNAGSTSAGIDASTSISTATMPALAPEILATLSHASFAAFDGWDVRLSYCGPCLHRFVEAHAWVWWLEEQLKSGWTPPEDCRDGYDCKMQGRQSHAQSANHLCVPSTGEP